MVEPGRICSETGMRGLWKLECMPKGFENGSQSVMDVGWLVLGRSVESRERGALGKIGRM